MSFLERMLEEKRALLTGNKKRMPVSRLLSLTDPNRRKRGFFTSFAHRFTAPPKIIAEIKRSSPSRGALSVPAGDIAGTLRAYEQGGADALSILTEKSHFSGSLDDLALAKKLTALPVLRKDFIVDAYELYEAAAFGADAVLLIAEALEAKVIEDLAVLAAFLNLDVLLEIHSLRSFEKIDHIKGVLTGVNSRDLETLTIDLAGSHDVVAALPKDRPVIVESGINTRSDIDLFHDLGVSGFLIGTSLMTSSDPAGTLRKLIYGKENEDE